MAQKSIAERPSLLIYEAMLSCKDETVSKHIAYLSSPDNKKRFPSYHQLDAASLRNRVECIFEMLEMVLLNGDRPLLLCYTNFLARQLLKEGVGCDELCTDLLHLSGSIEARLRQMPGLQQYQQKIHDEIGLTMRMVIDEIRDVYDLQNGGESDGDV